MGRDVWAPVTIALCRNMAFDGIKFYEMCYLRLHAIHLAPATRSLILHPAEHVWQQMVEGSLLSYLLSNSLCPVQPFIRQHNSRCTCRHSSQTRKRTERHLREGCSSFYPLASGTPGCPPGSSKAINRASRDAVVLSLLWMGGGGVLQLLVTSVADASRAPTLSQRDYD